MIGSIFYNIKQAFVQIFRNRGMSAASIFSILAMLLILGLIFIIIVNINLFSEIIKQDYDQLIRWRHHLHTIPELAFELHETAAYIAKELRAMGLDAYDYIHLPNKKPPEGA